ncbi:fungal-specific transcription factor domain-containing protein [Mycena sanguinolenta]|nr:fungal-specific transcription factor domain-containing protein [Mycena sanguinolenta]
MSSEEMETIEIPVKRRRVQRACDACRQKRRACDGLRSSLRKCTYCVDNGAECVFSGATPVTQRQTYTKVLTARLALTEKLLHKLASNGSESPGTSSSSEWSKDSPMAKHAKASVETSPEPCPALELATKTIRAINEPETPYLDKHSAVRNEIVQTMNELKINDHSKDGFEGESSNVLLMKAALDLKEQYTVSDCQPRRPWDSHRREYWIGPPRPEKNPACYTLPPPDLLSVLVDLYFEQSNIYIPLLHRPTLEHAIADNLHLRDEKFSAILLSVCAIASRFSDDPRVFDPAEPLTCGWKYFSQLTHELDLLSSPTLYDVQRCCLGIQFLEGSASQGVWKLVGLGIRLAQEVGAHRRQVAPHTIEAELWRRAFWLLVSYDRLTSLNNGRPCAVQYYDFDVQMPTECDDEYWEHEDSAQAFRQPLGKPSQVAFFNSYLRLSNILASVLQTIYPLHKAKDLRSAESHTWDERVLMELDSALNKWIEEIPEHLRWDAQRADPVFFKQSAVLYCTLYFAQMTAHRPFVPMVRETPTTLPSLAICTNAARSCSQIIHVWCERMKDPPATILLSAVTTAGLILLLNVWSGKHTGLAPHMNSSITEVQKCMRALRILEPRWKMAGLFGDIFKELATIEQVPHLTNVPAITRSDSVHLSTPATTANQRKRRYSGSSNDASHTKALEAPLDSASPFALPPDLNDTSFLWLGALNQVGTLPKDVTDLNQLPDFPPPSNYTFRSPIPQQDAEYPTPAAWTSLQAFLPLTSHGLAAQTRMSEQDALSIMNDDAIAMWANAPTTLGADDWGNYFRTQERMFQ